MENEAQTTTPTTVWDRQRDNQIRRFGALAEAEIAEGLAEMRRLNIPEARLRSLVRVGTNGPWCFRIRQPVTRGVLDESAVILQYPGSTRFEEGIVVIDDAPAEWDRTEAELVRRERIIEERDRLAREQHEVWLAKTTEEGLREAAAMEARRVAYEMFAGEDWDRMAPIRQLGFALALVCEDNGLAEVGAAIRSLMHKSGDDGRLRFPGRRWR